MKLSNIKEKFSLITFGDKPLVKRTALKALLLTMSVGAMGTGIKHGIDFSNRVFPLDYVSQPVMTPMEKARFFEEKKIEIEGMLSGGSAYATAVSKDVGVGITIVDGSDPRLKEIITEIPIEAVNSYQALQTRYGSKEDATDFVYARLFSDLLYGSDAKSAIAKNSAYKILKNDKTHNHALLPSGDNIENNGFCVMKATGGGKTFKEFGADISVAKTFVFLHEMAHCIDVEGVTTPGLEGGYFGRGGVYSGESFADLVSGAIMTQKTGNWDIVKNTIIPLRAINGSDDKHNSQVILNKFMKDVTPEELVSMSQSEVINKAINYFKYNEPRHYENAHVAGRSSLRKEYIIASYEDGYDSTFKRMDDQMGGGNPIEEVEREIRNNIKSHAQKVINFELYNQGEEDTEMKSKVIGLGKFYLENIATDTEKKIFSQRINSDYISDYEKIKGVARMLDVTLDYDAFARAEVNNEAIVRLNQEILSYAAKDRPVEHEHEHEHSQDIKHDGKNKGRNVSFEI